MTLTAPVVDLSAGPRATCPRCGGATLRIERHRDHNLERERIVYACGHDRWTDPVGIWTPRAKGDPRRRCVTCGILFDLRPGQIRASVCDACLKDPTNRRARRHDGAP